LTHSFPKAHSARHCQLALNLAHDLSYRVTFDISSVSRKFLRVFLVAALAGLCSANSHAQDAAPYVGLRVSAYLTQSILTNCGSLTGVGKEGGYTFRTRPGIMGDVLVDWKPRGKGAKWMFSSGLGIWWWSYRVGLRRSLVPGELYYLPSEGQGAIALQVPLRASFRLHPAVEIGGGVSLTRHLDGAGYASGGGGGSVTAQASVQVFSTYASRPYSSLTTDAFVSFRASNRLGFSLRATLDSKPFEPVTVTSIVTDPAGSRSYHYSGSPHFLFYSLGVNFRIL
jgi:hypothetical protein